MLNQYIVRIASDRRLMKYRFIECVNYSIIIIWLCFTICDQRTSSTSACMACRSNSRPSCVRESFCLRLQRKDLQPPIGNDSADYVSKGRNAMGPQATARRRHTWIAFVKH